MNLKRLFSPNSVQTLSLMVSLTFRWFLSWDCNLSLGQKGFNFGVKHCVIIEPVLKAFEGITNHRQRRQQQLQRPQLQQRQLLLLGIYTVNELNPRVFLFILFSDINQIFKSNSGEYDTEFSQQSKHNLEAPINQTIGSDCIIFS